MKLVQIEQGLGRWVTASDGDSDGDCIELLDTPFADMDAALANAGLAELTQAQVTDRIPVADAHFLRVVAGLAPLNDVSARDVQAQGGLEGVANAKGFPTFKPIGPCLATLDEFTHLHSIGSTTHVNGGLRQSGNSGDMVFPIPQIVALVSRRHSLNPGDIICTGTPGGVAHGGKHPYPRAGDVVTVTVVGLPPLVNEFA